MKNYISQQHVNIFFVRKTPCYAKEWNSAQYYGNLWNLCLESVKNVFWSVNFFSEEDIHTSIGSLGDTLPSKKTCLCKTYFLLKRFNTIHLHFSFVLTNNIQCYWHQTTLFLLHFTWLFVRYFEAKHEFHLETKAR